MSFSYLPLEILTKIISFSVTDTAYYSKSIAKHRLLQISRTSTAISIACSIVLKEMGYILRVHCYSSLENLRPYYQIESLYLARDLKDRDIQTITQWPSRFSLKEFEICGSVSNEALRTIGTMTSLRVLGLSHLPPNSCDLSYLQHIETLMLDKASTTDIPALKTLPALKRLTIQKLPLPEPLKAYTVDLLDQLLNFPEISRTAYKWPSNAGDLFTIATHIQQASSEKAKRILALQDRSCETFLERASRFSIGPVVASLRNACLPLLTTDLCSKEILQKFFINIIKWNNDHEFQNLLTQPWVLTLVAEKPTVITALEPGCPIHQNHTVQFITRLLEHGADPNKVDDVHNKHSLEKAIDYGNAEIVAVLLNAKVPVNLAFKDFLRFAILAVKNLSAREEIVLLLLQHGAHPNLRDYEGRTLLFDCIRLLDQTDCEYTSNSIQTCLSRLLEYGADVHAKDDHEISIQKYLMISLSKASKREDLTRHYVLFAQKLIAKGGKFDQEDLRIFLVLAQRFGMEKFAQELKVLSQKNDALDDALSQKDNEEYLYQGTDIHYIVQSKVLQKELEHVCFIEGLQSDHLRRKLDEIFRIVDSGRPVLCVYNMSNSHWVSFCIVKRADGTIVTLYKDSFGKQNSELVELLTQRSHEIKCHLGTEQRGNGTSCGIFALQNVRIMARALGSDMEGFINEYETQKFCSLDDAKQLRREDFARFYAEGVEENVRKEAEQAQKARELILQHEPEVQQIIACLREAVPEGYTVQSQNAKSGASNTIVVQIGAEDIDMKSYHYRIEKTADIDLSQLKAILQGCNFRWDEGKDYRIEDGIVKVCAKIDASSWL